MKALIKLQQALNKVGIELDKRYNGDLYIGTAHIGQQNGVYLKRRGLGNFTQNEITTIESLFPFEFQDTKLNLHSIDSMDNDGDRYWNASIVIIPEQIPFYLEDYSIISRSLYQSLN